MALWPEGAARRQLAHLARSLVVKVGGKAVCAENLHLTLVYIGRTDAATLAKLHDLITTLRQSAFNLQLNEVGFWKRSKIMVATARNYPAQLVSLAQNLRLILADASIIYDQHAFKPHVTLIRHVKSAGGLPELATQITWTAARLSLVQSLQTPKGSIYRTLADCRFIVTR
ncbi:MAG TPA: RNA 2',3'-cyclic phosphodiesterase [Nitrosomonas mobilis]|nr:RNA 2',3'-cyclic phosphodiesterase [Nitrosomonas mobilis]